MLLDVKKISQTPTPFYYYDMELLERTAKEALHEANKYGYIVHYALKANFNERVLRKLSGLGLGADCVSGNEVQRALDCGFAPQSIAFAGVGKSDDEINLGLRHGIFCFNCESEQEIAVIDQLAAAQGKVAQIALRINPNVDAHTHHYITTGLEENKFGIALWQVDEVLEKLRAQKHVKLIALHFHIGSQITNMGVFEVLCKKANELQQQLKAKGLVLEHINLGGGLGVDYQNPDEASVPNFKDYFAAINQHVELQPGQKVHFELGRSLVAQCGSLVAKVLYVKELKHKNFVILDAGMTDLIRPALYGAHHHIQNLTPQEGSQAGSKKYDVVGPICESSDCFAKEVLLPQTQRGDLVALRSAGAYGEVMASQYNLRRLPSAVYSDD